MKYSYVYPAILALAGVSLAANVVQENANGDVFVTVTAPPVIVTVPAGQAPPASPAPTPTPAAVQEKVATGPPASQNKAPPANPSPAPAPQAQAAGPKSGSGQICVDFSGGPFHFANAGSWGSKTGSGAAAASQCFGQVAGGAMFICESECNASGDAAPAKYTKLECNFQGGYPNCDISLVDGYSLPLECTIPGASPLKIGGLTDLETLASCPSPGGDKTCANAQGYTPGDAKNPPVAPFFANANTNDPSKPNKGGNYCVWQTCSGPSDTFWNPSTNPTISCQVGTRSASKKRSDGEVETRNVSEAEAHAVDSSLEAHVRRHIGGAHSHARAHMRTVKDIIG